MRVLLGIGGGIAAYKTPDLVRRLRDAGHEVQVVLSGSASRFVAPLALAAVSGRPVRDDLFDASAEAAMGHIELARWADVVLIAPATANRLALLAQGLAGDLLATLCLATRAPVVVAPAMNHVMWLHPATQRNVARLVADGVRVVGPEHGAQACGESGPGRMSEPAALVGALESLGLSMAAGGSLAGRLAGRQVLITAGGTREAMDPVRYLGNRSSGKMGVALARAAQAAGAEVTLVHAPLGVPLPVGVVCVAVESAAEMAAAVRARLDCGAASRRRESVAVPVDVFIGVAAVADFRPVTAAAHKISKRDGVPELRLEPTEDIVAAVARATPRPLLVAGFAAETENVAANARDKLVRKRLDVVFANDVSAGRGFGSDTHALHAFWPDGEVAFDEQPKSTLAQRAIELVADRLAERLQAASPSR